MSTEPDSSARHVPGRDPDDFIATWAEAGGSEQANAQSFVIDLCHLLDVEPPRPAQEDNAKNYYVFERLSASQVFGYDRLPFSRRR